MSYAGEFDGQPMTVKQVIQKYTAYSSTWVREALEAGCTCGIDFTQRNAEMMARQKAGGIKGAANSMYRDFDYRNRG